MPSFGVNAGVMGVEKTASTSQAGGIWTTEEQVIKKRNLNWPVVGGIDINAIQYRTTGSWEPESRLGDGSINNFILIGASSVSLDLRAPYAVDRVLIGTGGGTGVDGWSVWHPGPFRIESSLDNTNWTIVNNNYWMSGYTDPSFQDSAVGQYNGVPGIYAIPVNVASARYIRLIPNPGQGYVSLTEFAALCPGQADPYPGILTPFWP